MKPFEYCEQVGHALENAAAAYGLMTLPIAFVCAEPYPEALRPAFEELIRERVIEEQLTAPLSVVEAPMMELKRLALYNEELDKCREIIFAARSADQTCRSQLHDLVDAALGFLADSDITATVAAERLVQRFVSDAQSAIFSDALTVDPIRAITVADELEATRKQCVGRLEEWWQLYTSATPQLTDRMRREKKLAKQFASLGSQTQQPAPTEPSAVALDEEHRTLTWGKMRFERLTDKMLRILRVFVDAYEKGHPTVKLSDYEELKFDGSFLRQAFKQNRRNEPNMHPVADVLEMMGHGEYRIKNPEK